MNENGSYLIFKCKYNCSQQSTCLFYKPGTVLYTSIDGKNSHICDYYISRMSENNPICENVKANKAYLVTLLQNEENDDSN